MSMTHSLSMLSLLISGCKRVDASRRVSHPVTGRLLSFRPPGFSQSVDRPEPARVARYAPASGRGTARSTSPAAVCRVGTRMRRPACPRLSLPSLPRSIFLSHAPHASSHRLRPALEGPVPLAIFSFSACRWSPACSLPARVLPSAVASFHALRPAYLPIDGRPATYYARGFPCDGDYV
ncbi:uncharacterized protein SCHCODRAFT_02615793 [Schizophyllum commune H4-8]|uniref:uncharacterized protein n=1 Tax=Schizophyllum commune (strain H4-8 / FGSC 9210) TaxID=578458 RepID=UPI0021605F0F|nr:uncharacterized protein SCHCODRAFT_02615793 [Schizophyllum commune H4-8]KAI5896775.1 hypothetical protein SCHCODRAFT_02615793 [Schizophyllum commune H4-8]